MSFGLGLQCAGFSAGPGGPLIVQNAESLKDNDVVSIFCVRISIALGLPLGVFY